MQLQNHRLEEEEVKKAAVDRLRELVSATKAPVPPARESETDREERLREDEAAELVRFFTELHDENEEQARFLLQVLTYVEARG